MDNPKKVSILDKLIDWFSFISRIDISKIKYGMIIFFFFWTLLNSWNTDDAYHGFVMARNLANGNGFVYNIGERVNAATSPLFFLSISAVYKVTGHMELMAMVLCTIYSTVAFSILIRRCDRVGITVIVFLYLIGSTAFLDYSTGGLENSMLFMLEMLLIDIIDNTYDFTSKKLLLIAFISSLILLTRIDAGITVFPIVAYIYLKRDKVSYIRKFFLGLIGLLPFFMWIKFSTFYYGAPFPNTYYIKLNTGFPWIDYAVRGVKYYIYSFVFDPIMILIIIISIINSIKIKSNNYRMLVAGIVIKCIYIIHIGGDFMAGRHFADLYILSIYLLQKYYLQNKDYIRLTTKQIILFSVILIEIIEPASKIIFRNYLAYPNSDVADEQAWYGTQYTLFGLLTDEIITEKKVTRKSADEGNKGVIVNDGFVLHGRYVYENAQSIHISDPIGLADPLLARLPAIYESDWRVGHMERKIPDGYEESIKSGHNYIKDKDLHKYYDIIISITHDELLDKDRIDKLIKFNMGEFDWMVDSYINNND